MRHAPLPASTDSVSKVREHNVADHEFLRKMRRSAKENRKDEKKEKLKAY